MSAASESDGHGFHVFVAATEALEPGATPGVFALDNVDAFEPELLFEPAAVFEPEAAQTHGPNVPLDVQSCAPVAPFGHAHATLAPSTQLDFDPEPHAIMLNATNTANLVMDDHSLALWQADQRLTPFVVPAIQLCMVIRVTSFPRP